MARGRALEEVKHALESKVVSIHAKVKCRLEIFNDVGNKEIKAVSYTHLTLPTILLV